jgi:hypothetical protein
MAIEATKKNCVLCGSIMISHQETCFQCREKERCLKVYGCYLLLPVEETDRFIHCPECGSTNVGAVGVFTVSGSVNVNTGEVEDVDMYDGNPDDDFEEFICNNCEHEWENPNY